MAFREDLPPASNGDHATVAGDFPMADQSRTFKSVTVFGGATLDRIARSSAKPVMGASNPGTTRRTPGGVGFNVAAIISRLGVPTRLVTRLGDDDEARIVTETAKSVGIDLLAGAPRAGERTATYSAALDDAGDLIVGIADADNPRGYFARRCRRRGSHGWSR